MGLFSLLPQELIDEICFLSHITAVVLLMGTCRAIRRPIQNHLLCRLRLALGPHLSGVSFQNFNMILRWCHGIVSGSTALAFFLGRPSWVPGDLDIYAPQSKGKNVVAFFKAEGYTVAEKGIDKDTSSSSVYDFRGGVKHTTSLRKGTLRVDVVEGTGLAAFYTISHFHSTAVMNGLTGQGFFSVYPLLTTKGKSITNRLAVYPMLTRAVTTTNAIEKYKHRGFTTHEPDNNLSSHPWNGHRCGESPSCPHALRHTRDRGCLDVIIEHNNNYEERLGWLSRASAFPTSDVIWFLGGRWCQKQTTTLKPFADQDF